MFGKLNEMTNRFQDFERLNPEINLVSQPFSSDIDTFPDDVQLELIDLQSDHVLKEKFKSMPFKISISICPQTSTHE